jgi:ATP-dependent DNA helicase RecG
VVQTGVTASTAKQRVKPDQGSVEDRLRARGLASDWEVLLHVPLRYVDETRITPISDLRVGDHVLIAGTVQTCEQVMRGRRQLRVVLGDGSGVVLLRWLNFHASQASALPPGRLVRAVGLVREGPNGLEILQPNIRQAHADLSKTLTAIYPAVAGVSQTSLRRRVDRALQSADWFDPVPSAVRLTHDLPDLRSTFFRLHRPTPCADQDLLARDLEQARRRLRFDELLAQQIALRRARAGRRASPAIALNAPPDLTQRLESSLPFRLTSAQVAAWSEIAADLAKPVPMNRLLQGDVGSGKTIVAALACARALDCGMKAAVMAPTEVLAAQHLERLSHWLSPLGITLQWLAGKQRETDRRLALQALASEDPCVVVGTHALIQKDVEIAKLGVAVVDEQHRFGVAQRLALRRGDLMPHLLMLSATPIPRSLAMTYFSDLDVSAIHELPPGRQPVRTKLIGAGRRDDVLQAVRGEVARGHQAYWVCPLVEEDDQSELVAAARMADDIRAQLPELRVGLAHGQMPPAQKREVMTQFAQGETDILVATTLIEVGVDVPNATLMVIDHAERFGLASLHQLRGRVGRGSGASTCVLLYDEPLSAQARERLKVLYETQDGFEIARRDLQLRGPGEFLGARQSGLPMLRFADLERDVLWLDTARDLADTLLRDDPRGAEHLMRRWFSKSAGFLEA